MAINKVEFGDQTLIDLTGDTVAPEDVLNGATFHDRAGVSRSGTASYPVTDVQVNNTSVLDGTVAGGKGGYSVGNVSLLAGDTIYICIGGMGGNAQGYSGRVSIAYGGYNGGGHGREQYGDQNWGVGGGGGATHIGKTNTLLSATSVSNLYIVAGGGGGGMMDTWTPTRYYPGAGGGLEGTGRGGTQTTAGGGGGFGYGGTGPSYDYGDGWRYAGGGGGYYGGGYSLSSYGVGGGGGSGYIGGVTNGTTTADQWIGHGMAIISKV